MSLQDEYPWRATSTPTLDERIRAGVGDGVHQSKRLAGPLRDALLRWGEAVLTRQALRLAELGLSPEGPIGNPAWGVEVELAYRLAQGDSLESLQGLWELLPGIESGAEAVGWYTQIHPFTPQATLVFKEDSLPPLLVARAFKRDAALADRLLPKLQVQQSWAEAGWGLSKLGYEPLTWVTSIEGFDDSHAAEAPARVAWACAALGSWPEALPVDDTFCKAFASCTSALIWLAPAAQNNFVRNQEPHDRPLERQSPWLLSRQTFLRSILHLAQASQRLVPAAYSEWASQPGSRLPRPLSRLVSALGLELRLNAAEQRAVLAMCCPQAAVAFDWLNEEFWRELTATQCRLWHYQHESNEDGTARNMDVFGTWLDLYLFPAIWRSDSSKQHHSLIVPPQVHTRPLFLISPARLPEWLFLYKRELPRLSTASAAQAWVTLALWTRWSIAEPYGQRATEAARDALVESKGQEGWNAARALLKEQMSLDQLAAASDNERGRADLTLLRYMNLTSEEWSAAIAKMRRFGRGLHLLLAAGAPVLELARLLVKRVSMSQQRDADIVADVKELLQQSPESLFQAGLLASPDHLKVLAPETWRYGPWLPAVETMNSQADLPAWTHLIRHLAILSEDSLVRSICLNLLLLMEDHRAAD